MKTLLFCAVYAVFACVFCIGFAASQLPTETGFSILAAILVPVLGLGFTLFFAEEIRKDIKQIGVAAIFLIGVAIVLIVAYQMPQNRAMLIGSWSSELILMDAMDSIDVVGSAACVELLRRDRLTAIRAIVERPPYAKSSCVTNAQGDLRRTLLERWDEQLFSKTGTTQDAAAINALSETFPVDVPNILLDCAIRAPAPAAQTQCKKYVSELSPKTLLTTNYEWWSAREGHAPRFTAAFAPHRAEGLEEIGNSLVQRLVLRHSCVELTTKDDANTDLKNAIRGWMRHLKCYDEDAGEKIALANICLDLSDDVKEGASTAEKEVCAVLKFEQTDLKEAEAAVAKREDLAELGNEITTTSNRPSVDTFMEAVQANDMDSLSSYSEADMNYLIQEMRVRGQETMVSSGGFSKTDLQRRKIQQTMKELRTKKGMAKYFKEDGTMDEQAIQEKAEEEGVTQN